MKALVTPVRLILIISYVGGGDSSWCAYDQTSGWIRSRLPSNLRSPVCNLKEPPKTKTCNTRSYNDQDYEELRRALESIRESCGDLCDTSISSSKPSSECSTSRGKQPQFFECLRKNVNCEELWSNPLMDAPSKYCFPPRFPPKFLRSNFTYDGRIELRTDSYYNELSMPHQVGTNTVSEITQHKNKSLKNSINIIHFI